VRPIGAANTRAQCLRAARSWSTSLNDTSSLGPAAQVLDGLAVLPLNGIFEQVSQSPADSDTGDVSHPPVGPHPDDEPFVMEG